jgi:hypothetical protein
MGKGIVTNKNANRLKGKKLVGDLTDGQVWKYDNASGNLIPGDDNSTTNLSEGTATTTTVDVNSDTGTNATLQSASGSRAGLMSAADKTRLDNLDQAFILQGTWDASSGSFPGASTAQAGHVWIVSVSGTVDGVEFTADQDHIIAIVDDASTTTYAGNWYKSDGSAAVYTHPDHTGEVKSIGDGTQVLDKTAITAKPSATVASGDLVLISDVDDTNNLKQVTAQSIADLGGGGVSDGDKGDITVSGSGATWTIDNDVVTYDKIQNVTNERLLGNFSGGAGSVQELEISNDLQVLLGVLGLNTTPLYISDPTTVFNLDDTGNWTGTNYTGPAITGTFQGQHHILVYLRSRQCLDKNSKSIKF